MRALEVAHLDDLMTAEAGRAIRDHQMPLARHDREVGCKPRSARPGGIYDDVGADGAVPRFHLIRTQPENLGVLAKLGTSGPGAFQQCEGGAWGIEDPVPRSEQAPGKPGPEIGL